LVIFDLIPFHEIIIGISGILIGTIAILLDEIINQRADRREQTKQADALKKRIQELKNDNKELLDLIKRFHFPQYSNSFELGQWTFLILDENGKVNRESWIKIEEFLEALELDKTKDEVIKILPNFAGHDILKIKKIIEDGITRKYGHWVADVFTAGLSLSLLINQSANYKPELCTYVNLFLQSLKGMHLDEQMQKFCKESFQLWSEGKLSVGITHSFMKLIDYYLRRQGSNNPEDEKLRTFLESTVLPSSNEFVEKADKILNELEKTINRFDHTTQKLGNRTAEPFIAILNCLKDAGIDDPNLDLFLSAATGDTELLEKAIARGADVNIKDKQLVSKYRDVLQKNCPDVLKIWDGA